MKYIKNEIVIIIVLAIVFGFLSGVLGYSILASTGFKIPFWGRLVFPNDTNQQIVIDRPQNVVVEQDLLLQKIENDLLPTLFNIYFWKQSNNILTQAYSRSELLGQGFVLTADGWVITTQDVISNFSRQYTSVGYQMKEYELNNFIKDKVTGIVFGKINGDNLSVARLGKSRELSVGQTVVVTSQRDALTLANIEKIGYDFKDNQNIVQSSENLNKKLFLDIDLTNIDDGAVVANLKGEIVGLVVGDSVIMIDYFENIINRVLDSQEIVRPILGINYIDLSHVEGLIDLGDRGALIYGSPIRTSPAYSQLKDKDVIKKVNDIEINSHQNISELINSYDPDDMVELLVQRGQEEITIEIKLQ